MDSNPNGKTTYILNAFLNAFVSYIKTFFYTKTYAYFEKLRAIANAFIIYIYTRAYYTWSNKTLLRVNGITQRGGVAEGKSAILLVVYVVVAFLVATILFPIAMTQVTSAVTTSWNAAVGTTYVILLPILVIIALALHFLGMF